ncbi:MAG: hypothetical protein EDM05_58480 [Leptolyngbya sp. IPPAS B-1204]
MTTSPETKIGATQYEADFVIWVEQQAALFRQGRWSDLHKSN